MDIRKLQRAIVDGLEDVKAQNIVVFNTEHLSPLFERVIVASGTSNRQTKALAASVRDAVKRAACTVLRTEGEDNGEWIIVDCGAAVVHIMQPAIREYYHLEEIWGDKPVQDEDRRAQAAAGQGRPTPRRRAKKRRARQAPTRRPKRASRREGRARRRRAAQASRGRRKAARGQAGRATAGARHARAAQDRAARRRPAARRARAMKLLRGRGRPAPAGLGRDRLRRLRQALSARAAARAEGGEGRAARRARRAAQLMAAEAQRIEAALPQGRAPRRARRARRSA